MPYPAIRNPPLHYNPPDHVQPPIATASHNRIRHSLNDLLIVSPASTPETTTMTTPGSSQMAQSSYVQQLVSPHSSYAMVTPQSQAWAEETPDGEEQQDSYSQQQQVWLTRTAPLD